VRVSGLICIQRGIVRHQCRQGVEGHALGTNSAPCQSFLPVASEKGLQAFDSTAAVVKLVEEQLLSQRS